MSRIILNEYSVHLELDGKGEAPLVVVSRLLDRFIATAFGWGC